MHRLDRIRGTAGYSLMELLTVLVLVGIIASQAAPSLTSYVQRQKTRGALDRIAADVAYARVAAVRSGQHSIVRFSGPSEYRIEIRRDGQDALRQVGLAADYAGVVLLPPTETLEFNSRGLLVSNPGTGYIVVALGGTRDSLMITPAGRLYRDF